ncbi:MAG: LysR family transcriptional regulator [Clostridia bacterium]|nr:LysR family transcriptional regulator [Clostridia bacterium]
MDTQSLKTFVTVARLGSFTRAADELHYAQSTVTVQIQHLEKELGFPLFERVGRKTQLTGGGKEFLRYAEQLLSLAERARTVGKDHTHMKGSISIGVLESLLFAKMLPILPSLRLQFPNLEVRLKMGQTAELRSLLRKNQLDVIYVSSSLNTDPSLLCPYKRKEELVFVADTSHPLAKKERIAPSELFSFPFIVTEPSGYCYGRLSEIASEQECTLTHSVELDSIIAICALLRDRQSVAFLPKYALDRELRDGNLTVLQVDCPPQTYYSQLLCTKHKWISPFIEHLISQIRLSYPES